MQVHGRLVARPILRSWGAVRHVALGTNPAAVSVRSPAFQIDLTDQNIDVRHLASPEIPHRA